MNRFWTFVFLLGCLLAGIGVALVLQRREIPRVAPPTEFEIAPAAALPEIRGVALTDVPRVEDIKRISHWGVDFIAVDATSVDATLNETSLSSWDLARLVSYAHAEHIRVCLIVRVAKKEDAETWAKASQGEGVDLMALRPGAMPEGAEPEEAFWRAVLQGVRKAYHGQLVYVAGADDYPNVSWWDAVDYVGVGGPFALSTVAQPTSYQLQAGMNSAIGSVQTFCQAQKKTAILFDVSYPPTEEAAVHPEVAARKPAAREATAGLEPLQKRCYQAALVGTKGQLYFSGLFFGAEPSALSSGDLGETIREQWNPTGAATRAVGTAPAAPR